MTRIIAIDQATTTGYCLGGTEIPPAEWHTGAFSAPKRPEEGARLIVIHDTIVGLIERHDPDVLLYEEPYDPTWDAVTKIKQGGEARVGYNRSTMQFLQRVKGAVIMAAARFDLPTEGCSPKSWQASLQLPKPPPFQGTKEVVYRDRKKWIKGAIQNKVRMLGGVAEKEDAYDAWGICFYGCFGKSAAKRAQTDLLEGLMT